jgi:hypothetical protein
MLKDPKGMTTIKIKDGAVHMPEYQGTSYFGDWPRTLGRVRLFVVQLVVSWAPLLIDKNQ